MPDSLSRRLEEDPEEFHKEFDEEEEWISPHPGLGLKNLNLLEGQPKNAPQGQFWEKMKEYLSALQRPAGSSDKEFQKTKRISPNFYIEGERLKWRGMWGPQLVISLEEEKEKIMMELDKEMGHRGVERLKEESRSGSGGKG